MSDANDSYINALLEQIRDEIRSIHEAVADIPTRGEFNELRHDSAEIKQDIHALKVVVAVVSQDIAS